MEIKRSEIIQFRLSPVEKTLLTQLATTEARSNSEVLREALRTLGERRGLWPPQEVREIESEEVRT